MPSHILVVEDENIVAKDIERTLKNLGYGVLATVATGEAAIETVGEIQPDLVLMDIRLRGELDGTAAANVIRDRWNIPVVYLTAHADPGTLQRAKIAEPFGYVLKPFEERDLHTTIEMALYKHKIDRKLRENERWLTVTLNSIGDAVLATDDEGLVVFMNPVAQSLTGWSSDDAQGRPVADVFHIINEYTRRRTEDPVAKVLASGVTVGLANHTILVARDGTERPIDDSGAPIQSPDGDIQGVVLVFRDISERRQLEQSLQQRAAELVDAARRKDEFLAVMGHELRNPLAGIVNGIELLHHLSSLTGEAAEIQAIIARQAQHMQRILDDLLDVTRISRGKIVLKQARLDLVQLIQQAVDEQRRSIEAKHATLHVALPPTPVYCEGDATRLSQVVANLLNNAAKFLGGEGAIYVSLQSDVTAHRAAIHVRDTGIGMDSQTLSQLFEPFSQADRSLDRCEGGLGLGLALVRGLVELHGGTVTATSAGPGMGSEFTVQLPLSAEQTAANTLARDDTPPVVRRRILLIDDHQDAITPIKRILELRGHEVFTACDGVTGIALAKQVLPDVILCDIGLPDGVSGYDVAIAIREETSLKDTLLIAISGYGRDVDRERAKIAGFDNHVTKPVAKSSLDALLNMRR